MAACIIRCLGLSTSSEVSRNSPSHACRSDHCGRRASYHEILGWFDKNLKKPLRFAKSSKPHAKKVAISWFKDGAHEHISNMFAMAQILQAHGLSVEVIRTDRPGYIVYEDQHQVTAEPFTDTTA